MILIVGLGNPGDKYKGTRHNVGFRFLDLLAKKLDLKSWTRSKKFNAEFTNDKEKILVKPQTFMNASGESVKKIKEHYKVNSEDIWVIHDDLDIPLGEYKIQKAKGPRDHNGVESVEKKIGTDDFWRVRVGVDNRGEEEIPGEKYVLQKFSNEELVVVNNNLEESTDRLIKLIDKK